MAEKTSDDFEEEETFVYLDFGTGLLPTDLDNPNLDIKIIGIETDTPVTEINGKLFKGTYQFSIGTNVFFEKDSHCAPLDSLYDINPGEMYKLLAKTTKILKMKRLFVESKSTDTDHVKGESIEELRSRLEINMTYGEALNLLLPPGSYPPRKIRSNEHELDESCDNSSENDDNDPDYVPDN